ncbi:MAG: AAA family ATPase [Chloroflexota bacterium]
MLKSFTVENFRCFEKLRIGPLGQVNLIAGRNNVGKTALLEALWLHHGANNPELTRRLQMFRGIYGDAPVAMFENIFWNFDVARAIRLKSKGDWGKRERSLTITSKEPTIPITPLMETRPGAQVGGTMEAHATSDLMRWTPLVGQDGGQTKRGSCLSCCLS